MSWLGGSFSSLTGQLSNLTKDILTEGTEEVSDHVTELRIAQEKIKECQGVITSQKSENDRLRRLNHELEEKAESAELQINSISREYRSLLEEKEKEVNALKQSHQDILSHQVKPAEYDGHQEGDDRQPQPAGYNGADFGEDHLDFGDNISMQHEINKLTKEVRRLQAENKHWKSQVNSGEVKAEVKDGGSRENADLRNRIKELEEALTQEKEQHQHEVASLQDVHAQKMAALRRKLKAEVSECKETMSQLEEQVQTVSEEKEALQQRLSTLNDGEEQSNTDEENVKLRLQLQEKESELSALRLDHEKVCSGLRTTKFKLLDQLDANHAQSLELLCDIHEVRRQMNSGIASRKEALLQEKQDLVNQMIKSGEELKDLRGTVEALECEQEKVTLETDAIVADMGNPDHQKLTKDIIDTLEKENLVLKKRNLEQQEQITLLERAMRTMNQERAVSESSRSQGDGESRDSMETADNDVQSVTSDLSILTNRNKELDAQVIDLKQQIAKYEQEIEQFELVKSDWMSEKEALEGVLMQLREQLREKETSLNILEAQKGLVEAQKQGRKKKDNSEVSEHGNDLDIESDSELSSSGDIGEDIEKLDHKVELLTQANAELEQERDSLLHDKLQLEKELQSLKNQSETGPTVSPDRISKLEAEVEALKTEKLALEETIKECKGLETLLEEKDKEIEELQGEKEALESSLEELDLQHQEAMDQLIKIRNDLQVKVQDLKAELEEKSENVSKLQAEVERLQKREKAAEAEAKRFDDLEEELFTMRDRNEELEGNLKKLQQKANASIGNEELQEKLRRMEEKANSLSRINVEKEKEVGELKEKLENGAIALNDLHMDIKDLEKKVTDKQKALDEKSVKLKSLREQNSELNSKVSELERKLQSSQVVVESLQQAPLDDDRERSKAEIMELQQQLQEKAEEMNSVVVELEGVNTHLADYMERYTQLQVENSDLLCKLSERDNQVREVKDTVRGQVEDMKQEYGTRLNDLQDGKDAAEKEVEEMKEKMETAVQECRGELEGKIEALQSEKMAAERELQQLQQTLEDKVRHYENYIQDLQNSQEMDVSTIQQEHQRLMQESHEKDMEITRLEGEVTTLKSYLEDTEESVKTKEEKIQSLSLAMEEKWAELSRLREELADVSEDRDKVLNQCRDFESLKERYEHLGEQLRSAMEENGQLQSEIEDLRVTLKRNEDSMSEKEMNLSAMSQLEVELNLANERIVDLENQCKTQRETIRGQEKGIEDLNQKNLEQSKVIRVYQAKEERQEGAIAVLQQSIVSKEEELCILERKLNRATSLVDKNKLGLLNQDDDEDRPFLQRSLSDTQAIEYPVKKAIELIPGGKAEDDVVPEDVEDVMVEEKVVKDTAHATYLVKENDDNDDYGDDDSRTREIVDESFVQKIEDLQVLLKEKDKVIAELQTNNTSVLKMLETKSLSLGGDKTLLDVHRLENEVRSLKLEKEQILAVMNEKSREASNLKSEVHRLMNVISAEKVALEKLQQDNNDLTKSREKEKSPVEEMQKEALQNLSRIIRDKDVEMEALKQKNETLLAVLQDSSSEGTTGEIGNLMQEKENLSKQLTTLQNEREQMITYLNQKHQESLAYHNEIQRLSAYINTEAEKHQQIEQDYENLVPQFEEKKQTLLKVQNELINHKQKFTELELKYGELLQRNNASGTIDIASHNAKLEEVKTLQEKQKELMDNLKEKEQKIQTYYQQNADYQSAIQKRDSEISNLKKQIDNLTFHLQEVQAKLSDLSSEHSVSEQRGLEQTSQLQILKETNNRLTLALQEKEFEITSLQEKSRTLSELLESKEGDQGQLNKMMAENEGILTQARQLQQERDHALMALKQRQIENDSLQQEIQKCKEKESKSTRELNRLREHLLQVEDGYTKEALEAEEREKNLRNRLAVAEERLMTSSSAIETANQNASFQTESLQQQLRTMAGQRDQAYLQVSSLQDQVQQYATSLTNLQMVLEQFQQEKDSQVSLEIEHYQREVMTLKGHVAELTNDLTLTKEKLQEAEEGLEAASRLTEQMDRKEELIHILREEVADKERSLMAAEEKMQSLKKTTDSKVDKLVVRNLLLGYLTTSKDKQPVALRAVGGVLGFTEEDFLKVSSPGRSWMPGFLRFGSSAMVTPSQTPPTTPIRTAPSVQSTPKGDKSFSELFVKFLELESTPTSPMRLPAEEMVKEIQRQKESYKPTHNPFTAPRHVSMPTGVNDSHPNRGSPILMSQTSMSPTVNLFAPALPAQFSTKSTSSPAATNTSSAILKDVLGTR